MPVTEDPRAAAEVAQFGQAANPAAAISYNVPLPGAHSFQRIVPLEVDSGWFESDSHNAGFTLAGLGVVQFQGSLVSAVDRARLADLYMKMIPATAGPSPRMAGEVGVDVVEPVVRRDGGGLSAVEGALPMVRRGEGFARSTQAVQTNSTLREQFLEALAGLQVETITQAAPNMPTKIWLPTTGLGQSIRTVEYDVRSSGTPRIAIYETWQVSAFLGDYGLGKTLRTFSLLPGERTTISLETWRSDSATREEASSVFDSSDTSAQTRYGVALTTESGSAFQDQGGWAFSAGTKGQGGFDAKLWNIGGSHELGFTANHQEARQEFSRNVSQTNQEHSAQVNASRRQSVDSSSSTTAASGTTETVVREIHNTNLRRVLNFVFRELNQTYEVVTSLRDVRIAFYNGNADSAEIVPLAELRRLLRKHIVPAHQEELARSILAMVAQCVDHEGTPHTMLEVGTQDGGRYDWADATLTSDGALDFGDSPLDGHYSWRIKPGAIGQGDPSHQVNGVVTARDEIVLRTDSIVAEALLGQADALDPYASALQASDLHSRRADIEVREAQTQRTTAALDLVANLPVEQKVDAFDRLLGEEPDIEVVPVAAVRNGSDNDVNN